MSLRYTLGKFAFEFDKKNKMGDDVILATFKFSLKKIVNISISVEPTIFMLDTNIRYI